MRQILIVEDDPIMGESLQTRFELEGYEALLVTHLSQAKTVLQKGLVSLVISDYQLPDGTGNDLAQYINTIKHHPPILFMTAYSTVDRVIELMKQGASDFFTKPFNIEKLVERVQQLMETTLPAQAPTTQYKLGCSPQIQRLETIIQRVATQADSFLITGETGVGKEKVAQLIHQIGQQGAEGRFVAVNCAALPENLIESELYGQEKGAFTGAINQRIGLIEQAHHGTLFLDEIGDMPIHLQTRLLRVLQEREVVRLGGKKPIKVKFRLICATHQDIPSLIQKGQFREDLYYRINMIPIHIPPLRMRKEDILYISQQLLDEINQQMNYQFYLDEAAKRALLNYPWPGNIRELKQLIQRACMLALDERITVSDLFKDQPDHYLKATLPEGTQSLQTYLKTCEKEYICNCLKEHQNKIVKTAEALGISRKSLWERMKRLEIDVSDFT